MELLSWVSSGRARYHSPRQLLPTPTLQFATTLSVDRWFHVASSAFYHIVLCQLKYTFFPPSCTIHSFVFYSRFHSASSVHIHITSVIFLLIKIFFLSLFVHYVLQFSSLISSPPNNTLLSNYYRLILILLGYIHLRAHSFS